MGPRFALAVLFLTAAACRNAPPSPGSLTIALHDGRGPQPAFVEVTGLSPDELASLRSARLEPADWQSLLRVTVGEAPGDSVPPVSGRYAVTGSALTFTPLFPFDPGRAYHVAFDGGRAPRARQSAVVVSVVRLNAPAGGPTTTVTAVYPASEVLPENILRLYIEFSAPMGNRGALDFVRLLDERGREVPIPFLPVQADFWNADHTRYTLFFDPGRVKDGILPNQQLGRPLRVGHRYTIAVSADWRDARSQPLKAEYRRTFRVGPAETRPLTLTSWRVAAPGARSRDPLIVTFPAPLDHGLLARTLVVEGAAGRPIDGDITLEAADTRWVFRPRSPWDAGDYRLAAQSILEDPAGNRLGRAFEVDLTIPSGNPPPEMFRTSFKIVESGF